MRTVAVMRNELWRPIPGYEGYYDASLLGRIRSLPRRGKRKNRMYGGKILTSSMTAGYPGVRLSKDNVKRTHHVHVLVCETFHGAKPGPGHTYEVRHKDGNPLNCRADNLCWGTHQQNEMDKLGHGTHNNGSRTHCKRKHKFDEANTKWYRGARNGRWHRQCIACTKMPKKS